MAIDPKLYPEEKKQYEALKALSQEQIKKALFDVIKKSKEFNERGVTNEEILREYESQIMQLSRSAQGWTGRDYEGQELIDNIALRVLRNTQSIDAQMESRPKDIEKIIAARLEIAQEEARDEKYKAEMSAKWREELNKNTPSELIAISGDLLVENRATLIRFYTEELMANLKVQGMTPDFIEDKLKEVRKNTQNWDTATLKENYLATRDLYPVLAKNPTTEEVYNAGDMDVTGRIDMRTRQIIVPPPVEVPAAVIKPEPLKPEPVSIPVGGEAAVEKPAVPVAKALPDVREISNTMKAIGVQKPGAPAPETVVETAMNTAAAVAGQVMQAANVAAQAAAGVAASMAEKATTTVSSTFSAISATFWGVVGGSGEEVASAKAPIVPAAPKGKNNENSRG